MYFSFGRSWIMKINKCKFLIVCMLLGTLLLAACGKDESSEKKSDSHVATDNSEKQKDQQKQQSEQKNPVESTVKEAEPPIKEAKNVPEKEKKALLAALDQHVKTFNKKDLDGYMETISKNPTSFKFDEEKAYIKKVFDSMDIKLEPQKLVIIDYKDTEANIFTEMNTVASEAGSKKKVENISRQVNTFRKEDGKWKLIATFAIESK